MTNLRKKNFSKQVVIKLQEQWVKQSETWQLKSISEFSEKKQQFKEN